MNLTMKLSKRLSFGEEVANAVTHAVGSVLTLILLPLSAIYSYEVHGWCLHFCHQPLSDVSFIYNLPLHVLWLNS